MAGKSVDRGWSAPFLGYLIIGHCMASSAWAGGPQLALVQDQDCYDAGDDVCITIQVSGLTTPIVGGEFFLEFDTASLGFVGMAPGDHDESPSISPCNTPGLSPFSLQIYENVDALGGTIDYSSGLPLNTGVPTTDDAVMATIHFTALTECGGAGLVAFRTTIPPFPPTRLTDDDAMAIVPATTDLPDIIIDGSDPVIDICGPDVQLMADPTCMAVLPDLTGDVTASDTCDPSPTITQSPAAGTMIGEGDTIVTMIVADCAGHTATCDRVVTVVDESPPMITACAPDDTLSADINCHTLVPDLTGSLTIEENCGIAGITQSPPAGTIITLGDTVVTITVTDTAGLSDSCMTTLTVVDDTDPTIFLCAPDQTIPADASCEGVAPDLTGAVIAKDNCDHDLEITQSPMSGAVLPFGDIIFTMTVTDDAGNSTECDVVVAVEDQSPPMIVSCPNDAMLSADAACQAMLPDLTGDLIASDNCDTDLTVSQSPSPGSVLELGMTTVTFAVADDAGNMATCEAMVEVVDDTPPMIVTCPPDDGIITDPSCMAAVPDLTGALVADDNCDHDLTITQDPPAGTVIAGPTTVAVTITVEDDAGLTDECMTQITVEETTLDPVIRLEGVMNDVTRCITLTLYDCDAMLSSAPMRVELTFEDGITKTKFPIPCGDWDCVHAKDELHTLGKTIPVHEIDGQYKAFFTDDDRLLCGDANNDDLVDILDFGALFGQFLTAVDPNTPCSDPPPPPFHTDFTGDGVIDSVDFQCIVSHFLEVSDSLDACCGVPVAADDGGPYQEIRTVDLVARYGASAKLADVNTDGFVNLLDVKAYARRYNVDWPARLEKLMESERAAADQERVDR